MKKDKAELVSDLLGEVGDARRRDPTPTKFEQMAHAIHLKVGGEAPRLRNTLRHFIQMVRANPDFSMAELIESDHQLKHQSVPGYRKGG